MYTPFVLFIQKIWLGWASIFSPIPYGNPYIAFLVFFIVMICLISLAMNIRIKHTASKKFKQEDDRLKVWCKVMNIY
jgi:hypothetical protein